MQWSDAGIVLSARRHGEGSAIVHLLTESHGRHAGLVRGGAGRRARATVQPGNEVHATWRARLSTHLGSLTLELARPRAAAVLDDASRLAGLSAAVEVLDAALPEREPHPGALARLRALFDTIEEGAARWPLAYARWEFELLTELGFGLDLSAARRGGAWGVSPRTGAVVACGPGGVLPPRTGGGQLPLPGFLVGGPDPPDDRRRAVAVDQALTLTGAFLARALRDRRLWARGRLMARIVRRHTISGTEAG